MSKRSRTKGAAFERRLAKRWRDSGLFPDAQRRGEGQAKRDDADKPPDVGGVPFRVEAKDRKSINVRASLEQAEALSGSDPAVAVCHWYGDSMDDSIVCMRLAEWERLVERAAWSGERDHGGGCVVALTDRGFDAVLREVELPGEPTDAMRDAVRTYSGEHWVGGE